VERFGLLRFVNLLYNYDINTREADFMKFKASILSNIFLVAAVIIGGYALIDSYLIKRSLPSGVCPVTSNKPLIYIAVGLCIVSLILSFFDKKKDRINKEE